MTPDQREYVGQVEELVDHICLSSKIPLCKSEEINGPGSCVLPRGHDGPCADLVIHRWTTR